MSIFFVLLFSSIIFRSRFDLLSMVLKIKTQSNENDNLNFKLISKYFDVFKNSNQYNYKEFEGYFKSFYDFCYKLPLENMLKKVINFKY